MSKLYQLVVENSSNGKLGPCWSATYRPIGTCEDGGSCPRECQFCRDGGGYCQRDWCEYHQQRAGRRHDSFDKLAGAARVRHWVTGEGFKPFAKRQTIDRPYMRAMFEFHRKNPSTIGLGYAHGFRQLSRAGFGPETFPANLHILASCDSLSDAHEARGLGWRSARVIETETEREPVEALCPYDLAKRLAKSATVTCATCRLCYETTRQIAFLRF